MADGDGPAQARADTAGRRRQSPVAKSTPERLVEAAERLFAGSGLEGVSLRGVAAAAGVNSAAVHYHFGSREALVEAVLLRRLEGVQRRREELLSGLGREGDCDVRRLAEVLVLPWAEVAVGGRAGRAYIKVLAKLWADRRALVSSIVTAHFGDGYREIGERLARALPEIPRPVLNRRTAFLVQSALTTLGDPDVFEAARSQDDAAPSEAEQIAELLDFLVGGLSAPVGTTRLR
jgi:AcrR family transcriptional regulator